jgi:CRP-like cAMP-binding protein
VTPQEVSSWQPFLKTIPIFGGLPNDDIARVARKMQQLSLPKGAALYSQGDEPNAFYIITSGQVRLVRMVGHTETVDAFLGRGETLGEGGLMTGEPRNNTARLDTTCEFLQLKRKDFEEVLRDNPSILLHLSRILARRLVRSEGAATVAQAELIALCASLPPADAVLLSLHLALQLVAQTRRRVLLLDLAPQTGGLSRALGLEAPLAGESRLAAMPDHDPSWVLPHLRHHPSGLAVLAIPSSALSGRLYSGLYRLLNYLRESYDLILARLGDPANDVERSILAEADRALLAAGPSPDPAAYRALAAAPQTGKMLELWLGEGPPIEPSGSERAFIPWSADLGERFAACGSPYEAMDGRSRSLRAIETLARRLGRLRVGLALGSGAALGHSYIGMLRVF